MPESAHRKTPDLRLLSRTPETYIECKRSSVRGEYDIKERAEWHRICDPILKYIHKNPAEVDVEVHFYIPLEEISPEEVFSAFRAVVTTAPYGETAHERFRLAVRPLPRLGRLPQPICQGSPVAARILFGIDDLESADGFSSVVVPKKVSRDGLWLQSVYWRACLRWKSCSFAALNRKARGILGKLVAGTKQIPDGSDGILYLAVQEWGWDNLREIRWAKILEELGRFHHSAKIRLPYIFLNRLVARTNAHGGPDIEENCTILVGEKVGDPAEADRMPHLIFTAE